jgi:ribosome-binding protein aMBF1 (putative translation factor)
MQFQDLVSVTISNPNKQKIIKTIVEKKGDTSISNGLNKIENETENFSIEKIPMILSKEIILARTLKKITQKEIAIKLNIQFNVYQELENGKAIYNSQTKKLINKMENLLNVKFQNKNASKKNLNILYK